MKYITYQAFFDISEKIIERFTEQGSRIDPKFLTEKLGLPKEYEIVNIIQDVPGLFRCFVKSEELKLLKHGEEVPRLVLTYSTTGPYLTRIELI